MGHQNKKIISRLGFLGIFILAVVGLFWMGNKTSQNAQPTMPGEYEAGKAVLVEFGDFQCPACGLFYPILKQLKADFPDVLAVNFKHFPLKNIHKNAYLASGAAEAARMQDKFDEMHDLIFTRQDEWSESDDAIIIFAGYAESIGLNKDKFLTDIESDEARIRVSGDYQEGVGLKVTGTPTFFLNGKKITNPRNYNEFKSLIEKTVGQ